MPSACLRNRDSLFLFVHFSLSIRTIVPSSPSVRHWPYSNRIRPSASSSPNIRATASRRGLSPAMALSSSKTRWQQAMRLQRTTTLPLRRGCGFGFWSSAGRGSCSRCPVATAPTGGYKSGLRRLRLSLGLLGSCTGFQAVSKDRPAYFAEAVWPAGRLSPLIGPASGTYRAGRAKAKETRSPARKVRRCRRRLSKRQGSAKMRMLFTTHNL